MTQYTIANADDATLDAIVDKMVATLDRDAPDLADGQRFRQLLRMIDLSARAGVYASGGKLYMAEEMMERGDRDHQGVAARVAEQAAPITIDANTRVSGIVESAIASLEQAGMKRDDAAHLLAIQGFLRMAEGEREDLHKFVGSFLP